MACRDQSIKTNTKAKYVLQPKGSSTASRLFVGELEVGGNWATTATAPGISDTKQPRDQRPTPPPPPPPSQFFKSDHMLLVMLEGHQAAVRFLMLAAADARPRKSLALVSPAERHSWAGRQWALSPGARGTAGLSPRRDADVVLRPPG